MSVDLMKQFLNSSIGTDNIKPLDVKMSEDTCLVIKDMDAGKHSVGDIYVDTGYIGSCEPYNISGDRMLYYQKMSGYNLIVTQDNNNVYVYKQQDGILRLMQQLGGGYATTNVAFHDDVNNNIFQIYLDVEGGTYGRSHRLSLYNRETLDPIKTISKNVTGNRSDTALHAFYKDGYFYSVAGNRYATDHTMHITFTKTLLDRNTETLICDKIDITESSFFNITKFSFLKLKDNFFIHVSESGVNKCLMATLDNSMSFVSKVYANVHTKMSQFNAFNISENLFVYEHNVGTLDVFSCIDNATEELVPKLINNIQLPIGIDEVKILHKFEKNSRIVLLGIATYSNGANKMINFEIIGSNFIVLSEYAFKEDFLAENLDGLPQELDILGLRTLKSAEGYDTNRVVFCDKLDSLSGDFNIAIINDDYSISFACYVNLAIEKKAGVRKYMLERITYTNNLDGTRNIESYPLGIVNSIYGGSVSVKISGLQQVKENMRHDKRYIVNGVTIGEYVNRNTIKVYLPNER